MKLENKKGENMDDTLETIKAQLADIIELQKELIKTMKGE